MDSGNYKKLAFAAMRLFLILAICITGLSASASADGDGHPAKASARSFAKAEYLAAGMTSTVSDVTHRVSLIDEVEKAAESDVGPDSYRSIVYGADPETAFTFLLEAGRKRELVYAGTFADTADVSAQFDYLTNINGFMAAPASQYRYYGGYSSELAAGDILFWSDAGGRYVNAGLVCAVHRSYDEIAVSDGSGAYIIILSDDTAQSLDGFTAIRPIYSSNEHLVYLFCRDEMGYTKTGACGMLANIDRESAFRTGVEEVDTGEGLGICQWSFERRTALVNWCKKNGYSYKTLTGQLQYLKHEMETDYASTDLLLKTIEENSTGAYDAGYWVCFEYEQPYDFEFVSDDRGCRSRDSYWPYYSGVFA